jgi:carboxypeptidase family protein
VKWTLLAALLVFAAPAYAQTSRGTVTGTVLDPGGAVIRGAHITLIGIDTGVRLSTESNETGVYRLDAVDPGIYDLEATRTGFRTFVATGVGVEANRATTVDPKLELGMIDARVEVNGESSELLTKDSPLRGGNFQPREVRDHSSNSRGRLRADRISAFSGELRHQTQLERFPMAEVARAIIGTIERHSERILSASQTA